MEIQQGFLSGRRRGFIIIGIVVVIIMAVLVGINIKNKPVRIAKLFLSHLSHAMVEEAYNLTSAEFREAVPLEGIRVFVEQNQVLTKFSKLRFNKKDAEAGTITLWGDLITKEEGDKKTTPIKIIVVKEGRKWRVFSLTFTGAQ